jgi:hypothetical protein
MGSTTGYKNGGEMRRITSISARRTVALAPMIRNVFIRILFPRPHLLYISV